MDWFSTVLSVASILYCSLELVLLSSYQQDMFSLTNKPLRNAKHRRMTEGEFHEQVIAYMVDNGICSLAH